MCKRIPSLFKNVIKLAAVDEEQPSASATVSKKTRIEFPSEMCRGLILTRGSAVRR